MVFLFFLYKLLFLLTCAVLVVLVLLQHGKGGGLAGMLGGAGGSEAFIGPGGASKMAKITVICAVFFFTLCLGFSIIRPPNARSIVRQTVGTEPVALEALQATPAAGETTGDQAPQPAGE